MDSNIYMKKIIILTLFSFFSAMGGDFGLVPYVPNTISPRQLDYRTNGHDIDMHDTASFASFRPDLIPLYMPSTTPDETLPATDYQDFDIEEDFDALLSSAKRITHTAVQDDGPAHTFAIPSPSLILDQGQQSVLATQSTKISDSESSSTDSSKKRSHSEISEITTDTWCNTCEMHVKGKLKKHIQLATHKRMLELRAQRKNAVVVHLGGINYKIMTKEKAQKYHKADKQFQEMLQDKNVWAYDAENEHYTCILCNMPCTTKQTTHKHIKTYKHCAALCRLSKQLHPHLIPSYMSSATSDETLPATDYQDFDTEEDLTEEDLNALLSSIKRTTHTPLQDGPALTFDSLSPSVQYDSPLSTTSSATTIDYASSSTASSHETLDQESQSASDTQNTKDSDSEDLSTKSSKKRSYSLVMTSPTTLKLSLRDNNALPDPCLTQGTNDIVHISRSRKSMTPEKAQEYNEKEQLVKEALQDKSVWQQSKDNRYKCLPCNSSYLRGIINIYSHIHSKTHRNTLGLEQGVAHICPTCKLELSGERSLQKHETADFHLKIKELLAQGIHARAVQVGGKHYEAMTEEEAQEYHKKNEQREAELQNKSVWEYDTKNNYYTCKLCSRLCVDNMRIHQHRKSKKHLDALARLERAIEKEI